MCMSPPKSAVMCKSRRRGEGREVFTWVKTWYCAKTSSQLWGVPLLRLLVISLFIRMISDKKFRLAYSLAYGLVFTIGRPQAHPFLLVSPAVYQAPKCLRFEDDSRTQTHAVIAQRLSALLDLSWHIVTCKSTLCRLVALKVLEKHRVSSAVRAASDRTKTELRSSKSQLRFLLLNDQQGTLWCTDYRKIITDSSKRKSCLANHPGLEPGSSCCDGFSIG